MKPRSGAWVVVAALLCLALPAAAVAVDGSTDTTVPPVDLPEVPRMVAFELFAPPASGGG